MKEVFLSIGEIPAVLYGEKSSRLYLFVHGKQGHKEEAAAFAAIVCPKGWQVLAIDLPGHGTRQNVDSFFVPWHVVPELQAVMSYAKSHWTELALRATSIGAWFSLLAFQDEPLCKALFVSPVLDMERLIRNMMLWAGVDEARLEAQGEIITDFGETLSWAYLQYARANPIDRWNIDTAILYAGRDNLTERTVVDDFVRRFGCDLTVMEEGEHWFHTPRQLDFLQSWETEQRRKHMCEKTRCAWAGELPIYVEYHDHEWGRPERGDNKLFEMLILEGMQAGLSWITILNKRAAFRAAFDCFDPAKVALYDEAKVAALLTNEGIIRNRLKINAAVTNAKAFLEVQKNHGSFHRFIWAYVNDTPIQNHWERMEDVPATTPLSDQISKDLKKLGFKFVGSTIVYAFMQAIGMVNDHFTGCFLYGE